MFLFSLIKFIKFNFLKTTTLLIVNLFNLPLKKSLNFFINFNFLGKKHDINSALMDYDVYICSSYFESSPISVREAMATGLPILSTDVGDVKELLLEGGGLICHNLEEFVLNLGKFLNGQLDFNSMSSKSSNFAKNNFKGIKCAEKHLELFNTISFLFLYKTKL